MDPDSRAAWPDSLCAGVPRSHGQTWLGREEVHRHLFGFQYDLFEYMLNYTGRRQRCTAGHRSGVRRERQKQPSHSTSLTITTTLGNYLEILICSSSHCESYWCRYGQATMTGVNLA